MTQVGSLAGSPTPCRCPLLLVVHFLRAMHVTAVVFVQHLLLALQYLRLLGPGLEFIECPLGAALRKYILKVKKGA